MALHLLHLGKTGGTAVAHALRPVAAAHGIVLHPHATVMMDIPVGQRFAFFLRDPLARFVSGFNSRRRRGAPRYDVDWTEGEARAFARFETPGALGRALSAEDPALRAAAVAAMRDIAFVNSQQLFWFVSPEMLMARARDIALVGFQETLAADFARLVDMMGLPAGLALPEGEVDAHRAPAGSPNDLDALAAANLRRWYARDIAFVAFCRGLRGRG